ncbi:MAG: hypothetical protein OXB84_00095 [Halobacteriovoraceae bacterium]|nr:hypothetical protein [Halobacteriovoraceae bacterium]
MKYFYIIFIVFFSAKIHAAKFKYRTLFNNCPVKSAGSFVLEAVKIFEKDPSLKTMKDNIVKHSLKEKYFIANYKINYRPFRKFLKFDLNCSHPLMKVQIYKKNGIDSQKAILVDTGELYGSAYEKLLRAENKLDTPLPFLALPEGEFDEKLQNKITRVMNSVGINVKEKISEIIVDKESNLTMILSVNDNPSSVFIGDQKWMKKVGKLGRIIDFMDTKNTFPSIINLTNSEKVVVKFR